MIRSRTRRRSRAAEHVAVSAALVLGVLAAAPVADAGAPPVVIDVTTTTDITNGGDGETSLREAFALADANGSDTVIRLLPDERHELTDCGTGTDGRLEESSSEALTVRGRGATVAQRCDDGGVMSSYGGDVTVSDVTLTGGDEDACCGGGLNATTVTGKVLISDVRFVDNHTSDGSGGGGLFADSPLEVRIERSQFLGNEATSGGSGGGAFVTSSLIVVDSVFADNASTASIGGGLRTDGPTLLENVTVAGNSSASSGSGVYASGDLQLKHVTVASNEGAVAQVVAGTQLRAGGTVLTDPQGDPGNCFSPTVVSLGHNHTTVACGFDGSGDVDGGPDPELRSLFDNGGGTLTMYPRAGSPLVGAVPNADDELPAADQRGLGRPAGVGGDVGAVEVQQCGGRFTDLAGFQAFCWEIGWLADAGITTGNADGSFGVLSPVTRASMAAFLYRLAGSPAFTAPGVATFSDVPVGSTFFEAVEWLADAGVTSGRGDGTFGAGQAVTRASMAAFLFRLAGEPAFSAPGTATFSDVPTTHGFFVPVEWLATTGITGGYADGTFRPAVSVSRQSMAAFLYRFADAGVSVGGATP